MIMFFLIAWPAWANIIYIYMQTFLNKYIKLREPNPYSMQKCLYLSSISGETEPVTYKKLAHTIMDAGKSYDLLGKLASWGLRRATGVVIVWRLEAWDPGNADVLVWFWRQEKS